MALEVVERVLAGLDWTLRDVLDALQPEPAERGTPLETQRSVRHPAGMAAGVNTRARRRHREPCDYWPVESI